MIGRREAKPRSRRPVHFSTPESLLCRHAVGPSPGTSDRKGGRWGPSEPCQTGCTSSPGSHLLRLPRPGRLSWMLAQTPAPMCPGWVRSAEMRGAGQAVTRTRGRAAISAIVSRQLGLPECTFLAPTEDGGGGGESLEPACPEPHRQYRTFTVKKSACCGARRVSWGSRGDGATGRGGVARSNHETVAVGTVPAASRVRARNSRGGG